MSQISQQSQIRRLQALQAKGSAAPQPRAQPTEPQPKPTNDTPYKGVGRVAQLFSQTPRESEPEISDYETEQQVSNQDLVVAEEEREQMDEEWEATTPQVRDVEEGEEEYEENEEYEFPDDDIDQQSPSIEIEGTRTQGTALMKCTYLSPGIMEKFAQKTPERRIPGPVGTLMMTGKLMAELVP